MYDAVIIMFEGNIELKEIKKDRLKQQLDMFEFKRKEIKSFTIVNEIKTTDLPIICQSQIMI